MKKALTLALAAISVFAFAKPKELSKAQRAKIEKMDKANWGGVDYSAAPDGENSVANDLAQMRSMTRGEAAKMKKLYDFCKDLIYAKKVVDMEPEAVLGDALKQLGRPIDPTPQRMLTNISATPSQKLGFKSLQGAKNTLAKFGQEARPKMAALLKTEIETGIYTSYNRLARVTSFIEEATDVASNYPHYMDKATRNPFEIEHIITDHYEWFTDEYADQEEFRRWRNSVGALLLLHKSINASLNDAKYDYKLSKYCSNEGNIYTESLGALAYQNNPKFKKFIADNDLPFKAYAQFGKTEITERIQLMVKLVGLIWNPEMFI